MKTKLVSVIMPAYNGEKYIEKAIESVLAQTYSNWELIVVDDGSTDDTASIIKCYKDPRIIYVYQENRGQAAALNHGLNVAHGDYITTLDTDDWFTVNSIGDRVNFLDDEQKYGVVYGNGIYCDIDGKRLMRFSENRIGNVSEDVYDILISTPFFGTGGNVMVRRDVFQNYQIRYDESIIWCQDYDLYIRIAEHVAFGVIDTDTIWYRLHEANMTMSLPKDRRLQSFIRMKYKVLASPRFLRVPTNSRVEFFYQLLVYDLCNRLDDQMIVIRSNQFCLLPRKEQATLLRRVANCYLLKGENIVFAKGLLRTAWSLQPLNPKTVTILFLAFLSPRLAQSIISQWQHRNRQNGVYHSPFLMAKKA